MNEASQSLSEGATTDKKVSVEYRFSENLPRFLEEHQLTVLVSTYQAGQLVTIGARNGELIVDFEPFDRPMGIAWSPKRIAIASRQQIWFLVANDSIAPNLSPSGRYQRAYLARQSFWTGDIQAHELAWKENELLVVNTLFSCLCTLHSEFSFVPLWRPPFVSGLAAEDRCHLNGIALADGEPFFATALAQTDNAMGWRPNKLAAGVVLQLPDGERVVSGLCMPHSPRIHRGDLWVLNSGYGQLLLVHPESGLAEIVASVPGYARGLSLWKQLAFIGLSKIRESAVFGGVPIGESREALKCGVAIVDLSSGRLVGNFEFLSGVEEVFDVVAAPGGSATAVSGPNPAPDAKTIWVAPH